MSVTEWQILNKTGLTTETNFEKYLEMEKNKNSRSYSEPKWYHTPQQ